jgi:hypothetical protein
MLAGWHARPSLEVMAVWNDLKRVIVRLKNEQPDALLGYPDPSYDDHRPPFAITLAPWAVSTAADLHDQFGDAIDLTVGALPFPPGRSRERRPEVVRRAELLDPGQATVELAALAVVRSGYTLRHGMLLRNISSEDIEVATNGQVTGVVVDPETERAVGGFAGPQLLPLVVFRVAPGATERIPLLIGTASFVPDLGYAVPAGRWGIEATLTLGRNPDSPSRRTPVLPLTITN